MPSIRKATGLSAVNSSLYAMPTDSLVATRKIRNPILTNGDINDAFDSITYQKGGSVLNMFETYLGEEAFRDGIRLHMRRFEDGVATTEDFMKSLADGSGHPDVVSSFTSYIDQPGIPFLDVQLSCPSGSAGVMTVTQSRYAPLGSAIDTEASQWKSRSPRACTMRRAIMSFAKCCLRKRRRSRSMPAPTGSCRTRAVPVTGVS